MASIDNDIDDDDDDLSEDFDPEDDTKDILPPTEKGHQQKLMEKRRAIEDKLAQLQLERDTSDFYFDDLDD